MKEPAVFPLYDEPTTLDAIIEKFHGMSRTYGSDAIVRFDITYDNLIEIRVTTAPKKIIIETSAQRKTLIARLGEIRGLIEEYGQDAELEYIPDPGGFNTIGMISYHAKQKARESGGTKVRKGSRGSRIPADKTGDTGTVRKTRKKRQAGVRRTRSDVAL